KIVSEPLIKKEKPDIPSNTNCFENIFDYYRNPTKWEQRCLANLEERIKTIFDGFSKTGEENKNVGEQSFKKGDKKYEICAEKMTFNDAKEVCFQKGGSLLEINNENENDFIAQHLLFDMRYWIGAKRLMHYSSIFLYTNGGNMKYVNWPASEPKPTEYDNCVNIINGKMHTDKCAEKFLFICEYKENTEPSSGDVIIEDVLRENKRLNKELKEIKLLTNAQWQIIRVFL
ncbi:hypothetical protein B4U80_13955, partial [Leptotrombidium deliense]